MQNYDVIIVGAGINGCSLAYELHQAGQNVLTRIPTIAHVAGCDTISNIWSILPLNRWLLGIGTVDNTNNAERIQRHVPEHLEYI